jgi:hypothetical protein
MYNVFVYHLEIGDIWYGVIDSMNREPLGIYWEVLLLT